MKTIKWLPIFITFRLLTGCVTINLPPQQTTVPPIPPELIPTSTLQPVLPTEVPVVLPGLTEEVLRNSEYLSPMMNAPVKLVNGEFSGEVKGTELYIVIQPGIQFGDLNMDGVNDAALLLSENTGGSGIFVSLVVVYSEDGKFKQAPGFGIDDRPIINKMVIEESLVKLEGFIHGPNDPMVDPTLAVKEEYSVLEGRLVLTRLTSAISSGGEHAIFIDSPVDGEEVAGSIRLTGSMPIGPFENNLSILVSDPTGQQFFHSGFMVNAPDMGAPATFDNTIQLPQIAPGTMIIVTLSELSMANGTPMAIETVILKVK